MIGVRTDVTGRRITVGARPGVTRASCRCQDWREHSSALAIGLPRVIANELGRRIRRQIDTRREIYDVATRPAGGAVATRLTGRDAATNSTTRDAATKSTAADAATNSTTRDAATNSTAAD